MTHSLVSQIQQKLSQSRSKTWQYLRLVDEESTNYRIRPDAWSIKDHVAHLTAVEESVLHFAHRILHEDCPISPLCYDKAFSQDAWNKQVVAEKAKASWSEVSRQLLDVRQELCILLERIPADALNRLGSHPVWGTPVTLSSVLRVPYRHERAHRDEIAVLCELQGKLP